jgi:hypothetical protein
MVPAVDEETQVVTSRTEVTRPDAGSHRLRIPVEFYPVSAGLKGGLAGCAAMAVLAGAYGILSHGSIWYPINLLASVVIAESLQLPMDYLTSFHLPLFLVACVLHIVTSSLVGLLYGAMLPMFPRRPILLGGLIAPVLWSSLLYATLGIINPLLDKKIDWKWFIASQIGFGIVAGLVVVQQARVRTRQFLPFGVRAGIEAPGWMEENNREDGSR